MPRRQLQPDRSWVESWAERYDADDSVLVKFQGNQQMTIAEVQAILEWKLRRVGPWRIQAARALGRNSPALVLDLTARAFRNDDDLAALLLLGQLSGVGPPVASAILVSNQVLRYTVADRRAWASLVAFGYFSDDDDRKWELCWLEYLEVCRTLTADLGLPLRMLDMALWAANGSTEQFEA